MRAEWRDGKPCGEVFIVTKTGAVFEGEYSGGGFKGSFFNTDKSQKKTKKRKTRNLESRGYEFAQNGSIFRGKIIKGRF